MRTHRQVMPDNGVWIMAEPGRHFRLIEVGAGQYVNVTLFRNGLSVYEAEGVESGFWAEPDGGFDRWQITSQYMQPVKVAITAGRGGYDRVAQNVNVQGQIALKQVSKLTTLPVMLIGSKPVKVVEADSSRGLLRFYNGSLEDIYLGGDAAVTIDNSPMRLPPGALLSESDAACAAWWAVAQFDDKPLRIMEGR